MLAIAGSDSGGGAGIQADLKAFARCGVHGMTAITALTAQNTVGVSAVEQVPPAMIIEQVRAVATDIGVDAAKIGMLGTAETVAAVVEALSLLGDAPIVVDPVMVAESGAVLLAPDSPTASSCPITTPSTTRAADPSFEPASVAVFIRRGLRPVLVRLGARHARPHDRLAPEHDRRGGASRTGAGVIGSRVHLRWCGERLGELWRMRGPFPGWGRAARLRHRPCQPARPSGRASARRQRRSLAARRQGHRRPGELGPSGSSASDRRRRRSTPRFPPERRALLHLLARFDVSNDQAAAVLRRRGSRAPASRGRTRVLANPYLSTRRIGAPSTPFQSTPSIGGCTPSGRHAGASRVRAVGDDRGRRRPPSPGAARRCARGRAADGDTLGAQDDIVQDVRGTPLDPAVPGGRRFWPYWARSSTDTPAGVARR